jgi:RNA polymerase sigma-70 factor (ECF subfamily)
VPHRRPPTNRSDAALLAAARADASAFHELYVRHTARIYAAHMRQTRDEDAAHDLTAETFAQAWLVRGRFRDESGGSALPWLLGIARNVLLQSVRRRELEQRACQRLGLRERLDRSC